MRKTDEKWGKAESTKVLEERQIEGKVSERKWRKSTGGTERNR